MGDPRISRVFSSAEVEIDPTHPEYRPTEGMQKVLKRKRDQKLTRLSARATAQEAVPQTEPLHSTVRSAGGLQLFAPKHSVQNRAERDQSATLPGSQGGSIKKKRRRA